MNPYFRRISEEIDVGFSIIHGENCEKGSFLVKSLKSSGGITCKIAKVIHIKTFQMYSGDILIHREISEKKSAEKNRKIFCKISGIISEGILERFS